MYGSSNGRRSPTSRRLRLLRALTVVPLAGLISIPLSACSNSNKSPGATVTATTLAASTTTTLGPTTSTTLAPTATTSGASSPSTVASSAGSGGLVFWSNNAELPRRWERKRRSRQRQQG